MIPLRRHDRYVLKAFWSSLGAVLLFFTVIVIVIHLADRSGKILDNFPRLEEQGYAPWLVAATYYLTLVPFMWMQIFPLAAVLAAAFALSRLTRHNELAPLVTAGVSTRRVTWPIVLSGVLLSAAMFVAQEEVVPGLSRKHMELDRLLNDSEPDRITEVPHFDDPGGARLSMAAYQPLARRIEGALLTLRDAEGRTSELRFYPLLAWNGDRRRWIAEDDGTLFPVGQDKSGTIRRPLAAGTAAPLEADVTLLEVSALRELALGLSSRETGALVAADPDNPRLLYLHHEQFTRSLTPLVLLLLGLPFCLHLGRRTSMPGTSAVLGVAALQYGATFLVVRLAASGELNPVVMAWLPTVLGGCIGLALWLTMRS